MYQLRTGHENELKKKKTVSVWAYIDRPVLGVFCSLRLISPLFHSEQQIGQQTVAIKTEQCPVKTQCLSQSYTM